MCEWYNGMKWRQTECEKSKYDNIVHNVLSVHDAITVHQMKAPGKTNNNADHEGSAAEILKRFAHTFVYTESPCSNRHLCIIFILLEYFNKINFSLIWENFQIQYRVQRRNSEKIEWIKWAEKIEKKKINYYSIERKHSTVERTQYSKLGSDWIFRFDYFSGNFFLCCLRFKRVHVINTCEI